MFELEKILVQESSTPSFNSTLNSKVETSYMTMTINVITEYKAELREGTKCFYTSLLESEGTPEAITEAFSDFFKKIVELIKKFLKFIQKMFDKFISQLNGIIKSDKYIKKHKDAFKRFTSENEFLFTGYTYTIEPGIPKNDFYYITDTYSYNDKNNVSESIGAFKDAYTNELENNYEDKLRAWVIGKEGTISSEDYSDELFALFRNGDTSAYEFDVTRSVVDKSYECFDKYEKLLKSVKDEKDKLEKIYKQRQSEIESFDKSFKESDYEKFVKTYIDPNAKNVTKAQLSQADIANISLIMKAKGDEVTKAMDIHGLAFAAKLDAIKACYLQDKSILYKVLYKIGIRENGLIDIEDAELPIYTEDTNIDLMEHVQNVELDYNGMEVTTESGDRVFIEGEYDLLDLSHPTKELVDLFTEKGILQIVDGEENAFSSEIFPDDIEYKVGIEELPNPNNISYDIFLATEAMKDAELYAFIQESMMIASGKLTTESYEIIQEVLADSIKNGIRKIWNLIVTMWNKFSQTMEELFKNDVKYLEKYKDIILKKAVKIESITSNSYFDNNHGVKVAISNSYTIQDNITRAIPANEENAETYYLNTANQFLRNIGSKDKIEKLGDFQDAIKKQLEGPEVNYDSKTIQSNMKNMYDFCHDYKNEYKKSSKDLLNFVDKKSQDIEREIDKAASSIKEESAAILELEINKSSETNTSTTSNGTTVNTTNSSYSQVNKDDKNAINQDAKDGKEKIDTIKNDENSTAEQKKNELQKMKENGTYFLNYASAILGAKISFGEAAYKDYMKIIRAHVRMYAKNEEATNSGNNTTAPNNTDTKDVKPAEKVDRQQAAD